MALRRLRRAERGCDSARHADMILLDQDGLGQILAVIAASTNAHRVFFQHAQSGRSLSGIENLRARTRYFAHKAARQRGDAREALEQVQSYAFSGEQCARRGTHFDRTLAGANFFSVVTTMTATAEGSNNRKTSRNGSSPASTSEALAISFPRARRSAATIVFVVISPAPKSSESSEVRATGGFGRE
jgi:hypothetical protein